MKANKTRIALLMLCACISCGCNSPTVENKQPETTHPVPRLSFHRPSDLKAAIARLQELNDSLMNSNLTLAPISIDYVEVIHSNGHSGHSHFYLASEYDSNQDSEHGHEGEIQEDVIRRSLTVDVQTEINDIISWLPELAALADLNEKHWGLVKDHSRKLSEVTVFLKTTLPQEELRTRWKACGGELQEILKKLRQLADNDKE